MALLGESRHFSRKVAFRLCHQSRLSLLGRRCPVALRIPCTRTQTFQRRILRTREAMSRLHRATSCIAHICMAFLAWVRFDHVSPCAGFCIHHEDTLGKPDFAWRLESVDLWDKDDGGDRLIPNEALRGLVLGTGTQQEADRSCQGNLELRQKTIRGMRVWYIIGRPCKFRRKRLFTLLSIIVTDSLTSNKFKDQLNLSWMPRPFESVLGQVVDTVLPSVADSNTRTNASLA